MRALRPARGHRPCPRAAAAIRSSGVRSTSSTSSARVDDAVGHGLAHADAGDPRDDVVQAFDVLDVERRVDVDAGGQQFLDIQIALGMPAARRVGVGELVDQHQLRPARQDGVEVHLRRARGPCSRPARRGTISRPASSASVSRAAVRLDHADHDIDALAPCGGGRPTASRRSCRRRARRRGRS